MHQPADFNQICMDITFGLIFKVTTRLNPPGLRQKVFVCILSHGQLDGMLSNLQAYINRTESIAYSILVTLS